MDLAAIQLYDQHAHLPRRWTRGLTQDELRACLALGDPGAEHAANTVFYRRVCRDLALLYSCEATEQAIIAARAQLDLPEVVGKALRAAGMAAVLIDDGLQVEDSLTLEEVQALLPCPGGRILRIEALAEQLMQRHAESFAAFEAAFREELVDLRARGIVALKSVAAYRCGLRLAGDVRYHFAATAYEDEQLTAARSGRGRLTSLVLISYLVALALDEAARQGLPFQFHTGIGDAEIDLRTASPLHMRDLFKQERWRDVPFVLLHAYPAVREVAYMARVHPNVYLDLSLTVPFAAHGAAQAWLAALELAPTSKVLYGSDAAFLPELFYLAARYSRLGLGKALELLVADDWLTVAEAERAAEQILYSNALVLYGRV